MRKKIKRFFDFFNHHPDLFITIGLFLAFFSFENYRAKYLLSFTKSPEVFLKNQENEDKPQRIIIPSVNIDITIEEGGIKDGVWTVSRDNATHLDISSDLASDGNIVIYGHNKRKIFGSLPYVKEGDIIKVLGESGKEYNFVVYQKVFVDPERVDLVMPTTYKELTLYTCWGLLDQKRAVIKARPLD